MDLAIICPHCGAEIYETSLEFCPDCGMAINEAITRREAVKRLKASREQPQKDVNWLETLPKKWRLKYIRNIIINFLIFASVGLLLVFFWKPEGDPGLKNLVISIVVILGTVAYAVGTLDKTPLVKYRFFRKMCGFLRFIGEKGPPPG